jgi:hypothetical protein
MCTWEPAPIENIPSTLSGSLLLGGHIFICIFKIIWLIAGWIGERKGREWQSGFSGTLVFSCGWGWPDSADHIQVCSGLLADHVLLCGLGHELGWRWPQPSSAGGKPCSVCHQVHCWETAANSSLWMPSFLTSGVNCSTPVTQPHSTFS